MNAARWRRLGYATIFREGRIYLVRPSTGTVRWTMLHSGSWMESEDLETAPWIVEPSGVAGLGPERAADVARTLAACYCDKGVGTCEFCAGVRAAPEQAGP